MNATGKDLRDRLFNLVELLMSGNQLNYPEVFVENTINTYIKTIDDTVIGSRSDFHGFIRQLVTLHASSGGFVRRLLQQTQSDDADNISRSVLSLILLISQSVDSSPDYPEMMVIRTINAYMGTTLVDSLIGEGSNFQDFIRQLVVLYGNSIAYVTKLLTRDSGIFPTGPVAQMQGYTAPIGNLPFVPPPDHAYWHRQQGMGDAVPYGLYQEQPYRSRPRVDPVQNRPRNNNYEQRLGVNGQEEEERPVDQDSSVLGRRVYIRNGNNQVSDNSRMSSGSSRFGNTATESVGSTVNGMPRRYPTELTLCDEVKDSFFNECHDLGYRLPIEKHSTWGKIRDVFLTVFNNVFACQYCITGKLKKDSRSGRKIRKNDHHYCFNVICTCRDKYVESGGHSHGSQGHQIAHLCMFMLKIHVNLTEVNLWATNSKGGCWLYRQEGRHFKKKEIDGDDRDELVSDFFLTVIRAWYTSAAEGGDQVRNILYNFTLAKVISIFNKEDENDTLMLADLAEYCLAAVTQEAIWTNTNSLFETCKANVENDTNWLSGNLSDDVASDV
jgi:hypothetical protein